jgi:predicted nucleic acid-binding protein
MNDSVFVDTNVLVYLFDADSPEKQERARAILEIEGPSGRLVLSTQVLQEFFVSVTRKLKPPVPPSEAEAAARDLAALDVVEIEVPMVFRAISRSRRHTLSLWDASSSRPRWRGAARGSSARICRTDVGSEASWWRIRSPDRNCTLHERNLPESERFAHRPAGR